MKSKEMPDVPPLVNLYELADKAIEDVGVKNLVQVVTDNASTNMGAKALLHLKRPNIFWTSCAVISCTINLMLQGTGNLLKTFTIFVYCHHGMTCLRSFDHLEARIPL